MKLAVLSDIHGNYYALQEVLKSAEKQGVEHLLLLGDLIGYYYHPDKVLELLRGWTYDVIQGNHEGFIAEVQRGERTLEELTMKYGKGHAFAFEKLDKATLLFLAELPHQKTVEVNGVSIQMSHGAPWSRDEYLYPDAGTEKLSRLREASADFVLMGHTHYPCVFSGGPALAANVGSVGQSRVAGGIANWAVINTANGVYTPQFTPYDISCLAKEVALIDPQLPYLKNILFR